MWYLSMMQRYISPIKICLEICKKYVIFVTGAKIHSQIKTYSELCVKVLIFITGTKIHSQIKIYFEICDKYIFVTDANLPSQINSLWILRSSCDICHLCKNTFTKTFSYWCKSKIHSHIQINFEICVKVVIFVTGAIIHSQIKIYVEICVKYWIFVTGTKIHSHRLVPK